jgi:hypothetical protein
MWKIYDCHAEEQAVCDSYLSAISAFLTLIWLVVSSDNVCQMFSWLFIFMYFVNFESQEKCTFIGKHYGISSGLPSNK